MSETDQNVLKVQQIPTPFLTRLLGGLCEGAGITLGAAMVVALISIIARIVK